VQKEEEREEKEGKKKRKKNIDYGEEEDGEE
jgi:hypothetical protein